MTEGGVIRRIGISICSPEIDNVIGTLTVAMLISSQCAVEVLTSHKLAHAYFLSVAMVLVHAHCEYTRILHSHNVKVREPICRCDSDFRDVRAMCSQEVTSDLHSAYSHLNKVLRIIIMSRSHFHVNLSRNSHAIGNVGEMDLEVSTTW